MSLLRRSTLLLSLGALLASGCLSRGARGAAPLFTLADARGDDHGDGDLRYPLREDMAPGSMDLLLLNAYPDHDGTRFEVTFARPIARPQAGHTVDASGETQGQRARFGFYTFNLDLYLDTDRVEGSGHTETLPGRNLRLAPGSAWEKVVVLTPRPFDARDELRGFWMQTAREERQRQQGPLNEAAEREVESHVERELGSRVFFPTRVRVTGATVEFFVPNEFFGGGTPRPEWGYALAVTGADVENKVELPAFFGKSATPRGLMVLPIGPGDSKERFGGGRHGDPNQSPVVDLIVPPGITQEQVLGPNGAPWPAVVPAGPAAPAAPPPSESAPDAGTPDAGPSTPPSGG